MIIPQEAVERFERRAEEVRAQLRQARERGGSVPSDAFLEDFLARRRGQLIRMIAEALARQPVTIDPALMAEGTPSSRTADNLAAMRLLASKPASAMTPEERKILMRYKGWGGLSIEKARDGFPPSLQVDPVSLIHEYYTPWPIALEIARAMRPLLAGLVGADGVIRALEPSAGIGRFPLSFDAASAPPIRWTAIELSSLAAAILAAVKPGIEVFSSSFESWIVRHGPEYVGRVSLVVANPPFGTRGSFKAQDPDRSYREDDAWAYFLRRGLDLLVAGGLGVFIIPMGFMTDPKRKKIRSKVLLRHHLVSAFRLPSHIRTPDGKKRDTFPGASNVVDLVIFRRRVGELVEIDGDDVPIVEGRYFEDVPGHVLGEVAQGYRTEVVGPPVRLPNLIERPICQACRIRPPSAPALARAVAEVADEDPRLQLARSLAPRIDAYFAAMSGARSEEPFLLWPELTTALRAFTRQYGSPFDVDSVRVLSRDRDLMRSFSRAFEPDGDLLPALRERPPKREAPRARTSDPLQLAEHLFRAERGLTLARLMQVHGQAGGDEPRERVLAMLLRSGWCVDGPGLGQLVPGAVYFTGDLWARYDRVAAHPEDPQAAEQARRLMAAIRPALLGDIGEYTVRESWIPLPLVAGWIVETIGAGYPPLELRRAQGLVQVVGLDYHAIDDSPRLSPETISLIGWLNHDLVFWKPEKQKMESLNDARARRAEAWDRSFRDWIRGAPDRSKMLMDAYNRVHRGFVVPEYSEEPFPIARWTTNPAKQLQGYQYAGVRRILENRGGQLAWDTGVGKTFTALAAIAMARQEGWVQRPVVIVPNPLILQWRDEIAAVLPDYRVVLIGANPSLVERDGQLDEESETDTPAERAHKWARFQAGEYDLALLTYSSMPRTRIDVDALAARYNETPALARQLALKMRAILNKKPEDRTEREKAVLSGDIASWLWDKLELPDRWEYDGDVRWDDLGVDFLCIDEIHNHKNLFHPEPRERGVPAFMGSPGEGSARAWQLFFRAMIVRERTGGGGILGLSATPAKNGPIELYSVISYINPRAWIDLGIYDAENFVDQFCVLETRPIVTAAMRLEERQAMVGFRRLRELQAILKRFLDIKNASEMARLGRLKKPKASSELVLVDLDERQREKTGAYVDMYRVKIAEGASGTFHLGLITRLGLVAIHPNLDEGYKLGTALEGGEAEDGRELPKIADYTSPKFRAVAERVLAQSACGHIIFLETLAGQVWLKETLAQAGIPRRRIALLNAESAPSAADRRKIAKRFNQGDYTVVIANAVAGEGANLQRRTCAVHNVDIPWDPMTRRQRNGRADRQGNENEALIVYDYVSRRSGDGPRLAKLQGKSHWIEEVLESKDDVALNPAAQVSLSPIELLAELTEDAKETAELLRRVEEERRQRERSRLLRQVAALVRSADARYRAAERATDPLEAARLREEGKAELEALRGVDAGIWPFFEQVRSLERGPILISDVGVPFWDGLQLWAQRGGKSVYMEFGRLEDGRLGQRVLGEATWTSAGTELLSEIPATPASYTGGWPEDVQATSAAIAEALERLGTSGAWEDLGWTLASERFLAAWWPRFADVVRDQLARRTWSGRDELYPAFAPDGSLLLVPPTGLKGMRLFAPGLAGFEQFTGLARTSAFKLPELRTAARLWFERTLPAGLKVEPERPSVPAPRKTAAPIDSPDPGDATTRAAVAAAMTFPQVLVPLHEQDPMSVRTLTVVLANLLAHVEVEPLRSGHGYRGVHLRSRNTTGIFEGLPLGSILAEVNLLHDRDPERIDFEELAATLRELGRPVSQLQAIKRYVYPLLRDASAAARAEFPPRGTQTSETSETPTPAAAPTPARRVGHFWRVADRLYGDTALIESMQGAGYRAEHVGHGLFTLTKGQGKIHFNPVQDAQLFEEQSGRLHALGADGVDLAAELAELEAAGLAASGGEWEAMPTSFPPRKEPLLTSVDPPSEPDAPAAPTASTEDEPDEDPSLGAIPATAGGLQFTMDPRELQGAINLLRRVSVLADEHLGLVELECDRHVILHVGDASQAVELRFESTRCVSSGNATIQTRRLIDAAKTFGKGVLTVQKAAGEARLSLRAGERELSIPTQNYTPVALPTARTPVLSLGGDVLADLLVRTTYAMAGSSREDLAVLHFEARDGRLVFVATDGHRLAAASTPAPSAAPLHDLHLAGPTAERLKALVEEAIKVARPRGRGGASKPAPMMHLEVTPGSTRMLVVRTDLFTFAATHVGGSFPPYHRVVPSPDTLDMVCVVRARELIDALKPSAKGQTRIEFGAPLVIRSVADEGEPEMTATIRDVFFDGPRRRTRLRVALLLPALESLAGDDYVALASGSEPLGPVILTRWQPDTLPKTRRDALASAREAMQTHNLALVMPMRE